MSGFILYAIRFLSIGILLGPLFLLWASLFNDILIASILWNILLVYPCYKLDQYILNKK